MTTLSNAMDDYRVCDMCRRVTFDEVNTPDGFQHYGDTRLVCQQAAAENACRLCLFIVDALVTPLNGEPLSKQLADSQPPLAVRLSIPPWMREPTAKQESQPPQNWRLSISSWVRKSSAKQEASPQVVDYSKNCPIFVTCGVWDYLKSSWEDETRVTRGLLRVYNKQRESF
jgi:hypothetical protein